MSVRALFLDLYENRFAPYPYDFALITRHALSRIYEKYVALLRPAESAQTRLFEPLAEEVQERALGEVYTPQYIARFFARFLKRNHTPARFHKLRTIDPACGSGIFLRCMMELQCEPITDDHEQVEAITQGILENLWGIDIDDNACQACRLSLVLLHLVASGRLPDKPPNIVQAESIEYVSSHSDLLGSFDAVLANPPFVRWEQLRPELQRRLREFVADAQGRPDLSVALMDLGMKLVRPGGFLLYVLPHSFLLAESTRKIRDRILKEFEVRCLADLTEIPVFEGLGSYVVLLVLERRSSDVSSSRNATVMRCRSAVGDALQHILDQRDAKLPAFEVFTVGQDYFDRTEWSVVNPAEFAFRQRLAGLPQLGRLCRVAQGMNTGADEVFVRDAAETPEGEERVWRPLLSDREMARFLTPRTVRRVVFFPYVRKRLINEAELESSFPQTWNYLLSCEERLRRRASVSREKLEWWRPERSRPEIMFLPKIVSPHLTLTPRFALDVEGEFAISRSPVVLARDRSDEVVLLKFLVGVLNSSIGFWQVIRASHKYREGYSMLEVNTLKNIRVPDPAQAKREDFEALLAAVERHLSGETDDGELAGIDAIVLRLYGITESEVAELSGQA